MSANNAGQIQGPIQDKSRKWVKVGALAGFAAILVAAAGVFFQYINQSSRVQVVLEPVGYTVKSNSDGQFITVNYTLSAVGPYPARNVRINAICEAMIPAPEPVLRDQWRSIGDLLPGKRATPELCFIPVKYAGTIDGIRQSSLIAWEDAAGRESIRSCFTGRQIVVNNRQLSVMSPCT
jgi:hypothetical protein